MKNEQDIENGQELLTKKRRERKVRQGKKKISFFKKLLRFFTGIAVIYAVYYCSKMNGWYLPQNTFSNPNKIRIQVVNNEIVKPIKIQRILKEVEVPKMPIYMTDFKELEKKLYELPPVESVYIRRFAFPARLQIILRESAPIITISPDENVEPIAAFTKDAKLLYGSDYLPLPKKYKTILVLSYGNKGDDYKKWDSQKIKDIQKINQYVKTLSHEDVEYIDMRNPNDIYVKITSVLLRLGDVDDKIYERIGRIPSILPEAKKLESVKYVDLSWEKANFLKLK